MRLTKIFLLTFCLLFCLAIPLQTIHAVEYEIPDNFLQLIDLTFDTIIHTIFVDDDLFFDILLMDENFMAISALTRAQATKLSYSETKDYFNESMTKYNQNQFFYLMITVFDFNNLVNLSKPQEQVRLTNSTKQIIYGQELQRYENILILQFSRGEFDLLIKGETSFTIQIAPFTNQIYQKEIPVNYRKSIPAKITELIELFMLD